MGHILYEYSILFERKESHLREGERERPYLGRLDCSVLVRSRTLGTMEKKRAHVAFTSCKLFAWSFLLVDSDTSQVGNTGIIVLSRQLATWKKRGQIMTLVKFRSECWSCRKMPVFLKSEDS